MKKIFSFPTCPHPLSSQRDRLFGNQCGEYEDADNKEREIYLLKKYIET